MTIMGMIEIIKDVAAIAQKTDNLELYRKVLDLQVAAMEQMEQMRQNDEKIAKLERGAGGGENVSLRGAAYYQTDSQSRLIAGPFCTRCYDVDHVKARIVDAGSPNLECIICRTPYVRKEITIKLDPT
jgi:hypothetical protein